MQNMAFPLNKRHVSVTAVFMVLLVGLVDYLTGIEIRVFPLYFLPIAFAAWYGDRKLTFFTSAFSTITWITSLYEGGSEYSSGYIWIINFFTQGSSFVVVAVLLTKLHEVIERESAFSRTDSLTGLANSRYFYEQASGVLALCNRNQKPITLAYLDLDNFKQANDRFGHQFGDELLQKVAAVFRASLRKSDITARMGGDEFVILLPETGGNEARQVLEKIRKTLEQSPEFQACAVTASIGAVSRSVAPTDIESMIKSADEQMYEVKKSSKNQVLVTQL